MDFFYIHSSQALQAQFGKHNLFVSLGQNSIQVFPFLKVEVNIIDPGKLMTTTKILRLSEQTIL